MCRNIRTLHNFDPPATDDEVHAAALQYVRKVSGATRPSQANQAAFDAAVAEVAATSRTARSNASWLAWDGCVEPDTLRTYCSAAACTSSRVAGGSKLCRVLMLRHMPSGYVDHADHVADQGHPAAVEGEGAHHVAGVALRDPGTGLAQRPVVGHVQGHEP